MSLWLWENYLLRRAAFEQFAVNDCWGKGEYLEPTAMRNISGDYGKIWFLREHGAIFMLDL